MSAYLGLSNMPEESEPSIKAVDVDVAVNFNRNYTLLINDDGLINSKLIDEGDFTFSVKLYPFIIAKAYLSVFANIYELVFTGETSIILLNEDERKLIQAKYPDSLTPFQQIKTLKEFNTFESVANKNVSKAFWTKIVNVVNESSDDYKSTLKRLIREFKYFIVLELDINTNLSEDILVTSNKWLRLSNEDIIQLFVDNCFAIISKVKISKMNLKKLHKILSKNESEILIQLRKKGEFSMYFSKQKNNRQSIDVDVDVEVE